MTRYIYFIFALTMLILIIVAWTLPFKSEPEFKGTTIIDKCQQVVLKYDSNISHSINHMDDISYCYSNLSSSQIAIYYDFYCGDSHQSYYESMGLQCLPSHMDIGLNIFITVVASIVGLFFLLLGTSGYEED